MARHVGLFGRGSRLSQPPHEPIEPDRPPNRGHFAQAAEQIARPLPA